jgi:hypothetical protein
MSSKRKRSVPDMALHRDELEQLAWDRFAFLTDERGFTLPTTEREAQGTSYCYRFYNPLFPIGLEVQLDFREDTVRVILLRLGDGKPLRRYVNVHSAEVKRVGFLSVLQDVLYVEDARLDALSDLLYAAPRNHQWADEALARWQEVVERHIDMVTQQPIEVLFLPPPGASPASQA